MPNKLGEQREYKEGLDHHYFLVEQCVLSE